MLKERYLEENIMKTIDRAIHSDDYNNLKDDLQMYRAQKRQLAPEIENLKLQYASAQNSPQGPALKLALDSKLNDLQTANDKLSIYKDMGRQGLGVEPDEYKRKRAEKQGMVIGGLTGLGAGGLAGLGAGEAIFNESDEADVEKRILEEARGNRRKPTDSAKDKNKAEVAAQRRAAKAQQIASKKERRNNRENKATPVVAPIKPTSREVAPGNPHKKINVTQKGTSAPMGPGINLTPEMERRARGAERARQKHQTIIPPINTTPVGENKVEKPSQLSGVDVDAAVKQAAQAVRAEQPKVAPRSISNPQALSKIDNILTPHGRTHQTVPQPNTAPQQEEKGFWDKTINKVDNLNLGTPNVESVKLKKKQLESDLLKKTDQAGDWIKNKLMGDNPGEIKQFLGDVGNKTKDYFKPNDPSNRSRPANWINKLGQNKNMPGGGAGTAAGLAAGTLGLGGLGVAGLNAMFGGDDVEVPEVEVPEVEVPQITPTQAPSLLDKMPGGKVGAGVLGGLGAAGAGKLLHDKLKK